MNTAELDAIRARVDAATPGEWEVERLTQERDQARAVINQVSIELMRMSAVNDEHAIEAHNLLSQYLWLQEHPKADANAREDTPK